VYTQISIWRTATGEITESRTIDPADPPTIDTGYASLAGWYPGDIWYVLAGVATSRPVLVADDAQFVVDADGAPHTIVSSMPDDTVVYCAESGLEQTASGVEHLVVQSVLDGEFNFTIEPPFPHQSADIIVITRKPD
jgi:hypothetical protein